MITVTLQHPKVTTKSGEFEEIPVNLYTHRHLESLITTWIMNGYIVKDIEYA